MSLLPILASWSCEAGGGAGDRTFQESKKITASDAQDMERFGQSVAIDGDHLIVGKAFGVSDIRGFACIFRRTAGGADAWGEVKRIRGSDSENMDSFGSSVDISGDFAIVGAPHESESGPGIQDRGAAYVFSRDSGGTDNWGEVKKLIAGDPEWGDHFGSSVAINGDYAVIGAPEKPGIDQDTGAIYVFYRNQGGADNWGEVKKVTPLDPQRNLNFGRDVELSGELAIAGCRDAAFLFSRDLWARDNWGQVKKLLGGDTQPIDDFGFAVAVSGGAAIVGAHYKPGAGEYRGAAYVFGRDQGGTGNWGETAELTASDAHDMDEFGYSVALYGDYAIIGAPYAADLFNSQGVAYFYYRDQGGSNAWGELAKVMAGDTEDGDILGMSVGMAEAYAAAGAPGEDGAGEDRGAVYLLRKVRK